MRVSPQNSFHDFLNLNEMRTESTFATAACYKLKRTNNFMVLLSRVMRSGSTRESSDLHNGNQNRHKHQKNKGGATDQMKFEKHAHYFL
jgi:hypothetical protein